MTDSEHGLGGRLPLLAHEQLDVEQRALDEELDRRLARWADRNGIAIRDDAGHAIGPFNAMLYAPQVGQMQLELGRAEAKYTPLDAREREAAILSVGAVWKATFELYAHVAIARKAGFSQAAADALAAGTTPAPDLTPREAVLQRFTLELCREHRVGAALYREMEDAFGRSGLVHALYLIGNYLSTCAVLNCFEVPLPEASSET